MFLAHSFTPSDLCSRSLLFARLGLAAVGWAVLDRL